MHTSVAKFIYTEDFLESIDFDNMYETVINSYYSSLYPQYHHGIPF